MRKASGRPASAALAAAGCSLVAAGALVVTLSLIAEIAAAPTADPGIQSSTWTPITSFSAFLLGSDNFHGSFALGSIVFGLLVVAIVSVVAGTIGTALIVYSLGRRPHPLTAALLGTAWGLAMQILLINLLCNWLQDDNAIYRALPSWGWWVGMGVWGASLGLSLATTGRRTSATEPRAAVEGAGGGVPHQEPTR